MVVFNDDDTLDRRLVWREDWRVVCREGDVSMDRKAVDAGDSEALGFLEWTMMMPDESGVGGTSLRNGGVWCWDEPDTLSCCLDGVVIAVMSDAGSVVCTTIAVDAGVSSGFAEFCIML